MKGVRAGLSYEFRWSQSAGKGTAAQATRGHLLLDLAGARVWGNTKGFLWTWVDLLEHLATNWIRLFNEEMDPLSLAREVPQLRKAAALRWKQSSEDKLGHDEHLLFGYLEAHNLAASCAGTGISPLWVVPEGKLALLATDSRTVRRPLDEIRGTLTALGDEIVDRLGTDERSQAAKTAWKDRVTTTPERFRSIVSGLPPPKLAEIISLSQKWQPRAQLEQTPELVAARMTGNVVPPSAAATIIDWIVGLPASATPQLDVITQNAEAFVAGIEGKRAFEQGLELAQSLRASPGIVNPEGRTDPESLLGSLGVQVDEADLGVSEVEAVACWGGGRGPAVLINRRGRFSQGTEGRRATCAHELCHLICDRHRALPYAEVLGGAVPELLEKRANAFAAEFLIPQSTAYSEVASATNTAAAVSKARKRYGVSAEIIAWQVVRFGRPVQKKVTDVLRNMVGTKTKEFDRAVLDLSRARRAPRHR